MQKKLGNILYKMLGIKKEPLEWIEGRRKKKEFIMSLALKYLKPDMYMFFIEKYTSNRTADNIEAKPIADYIKRRFDYEQHKRNLERDKSNVHRRRQVNERSKN